LIARQRGSGLSVAAFCEREDVSAASFYQWRTRLGDDRAAASAVASLASAAPSSPSARVPAPAPDGSDRTGSPAAFVRLRPTEAPDGPAPDRSGGRAIARFGDGVEVEVGRELLPVLVDVLLRSARQSPTNADSLASTDGSTRTGSPAC
jgi:transposase-like protein